MRFRSKCLAPGNEQRSEGLESPGEWGEHVESGVGVCMMGGRGREEGKDTGREEVGGWSSLGQVVVLRERHRPGKPA